MAMVENDTYQTKIYHDANGDRMVAKSDATINIVSRNMLGVSVITILSVSMTSAVAVLSVVNLPNCKFVVLSMNSNLTSASLWLTSCYAGDEVFITMEPGSHTDGQVELLLSGCTLRGSTGSTLGSVPNVVMSNAGSGASIPSVQLVCMRDNEWSIVSTHGEVQE